MSENPKKGGFGAERRFNWRPAAAMAATWSLVVGLSVAMNLDNHREQAFSHARFVANAYIDKDLAVRRWISGHGGVYVKPSERTPPNPWLTVPNRDVTTTSGTQLTLVNPAYATRQLIEEFAADHGIIGHLTALKLKNPNNAPDIWEKAALERLAVGEKEIVEQADRHGVTVLRVMRPVLMEKGCFKCHDDMGIPLGGLRGGISTAVPMEPFLAKEREGIRRTVTSHSLIWLCGMLGIGLYFRRGRENWREQINALHTAQREDRRIAEVLSLSERMEAMSERSIIEDGLEAAVRLTGSKIGYFHFVNEDQNSIELVTWSKDTLASYCTATHDNHYPIEQAGIWADCARLHQPVVHNDYPNLAVKRGLPDGHAALYRHMSVPVIEGGKVRVVTGVGNKETHYDEHDVRLLQLLANDLWKIVQRKRADVAMRNSERRLREAQQVARMGSWELDLATRTVACSAEAYRILDLDPMVADPDIETVRELCHLDDRPRVDAILRKALAERGKFNLDYRLCLRDEQIRHVRLLGQVQTDVDGTPTSIIGTIQDITAQKEVEALRRAETNLTALFENTDRQVWSVDTQQRLVVGNGPFIEVMRQRIGREVKPGEAMPPAEMEADERQHWQDYYRRALDGEKFSVEVELFGMDDGPRWVDFSFFPIVDDDRAVRGVTVTGRDFTERRQMEETQIRTLEQMAGMVRELESHHRETMQINRLNDLLQSCRDEREAYEVISLMLGEIFHGRTGCLAMTIEGSRELQRVACWGGEPTTATQFAIDDCWALRRGEAHETRRTGELCCGHFGAPPTHGSLCQPLVVRGETLGMLNLEYPPDAGGEHLDELKDKVRMVGETVKLSLSNLRLRVALQEQATHDALTGLFNRRYLDETLPRELHRIERSGGRLAVAMLDIDHFKRFNDSMGHEAGDLVLRGIGRILRDSLRRSDIGCRYGGEELMVIMPDSGSADASVRLADVCSRIRSMTLDFRGSPLPVVTVSVGIAATNAHHMDTTALLRAADEALYAAKEGGRDRIVVSGESAEP